MKLKKIKKLKKPFIAIIIFSMVAIYGFASPLRIAWAVDSLTDAKDTISDSDISATGVTHTIQFTTGTTTPINGYWRMVFPSGFTNILAANANCSGLTASSTGNTLDCVATAAVAATSTKVTITSVNNPTSAGSYLINIYHYDNNNTLLERVQVRVYIIEDIWMTATVDATLTFTISGLNSGEVVNGVTCNATTTATSTPFGTLSTTASTTVCQQLAVSTNADDGFTVTVEQDQELTSDSGSNINSFDNSPDGTGSTTPHAWTAPLGVLDQYNTYGHMGLTSEDSTLSSGDTFGDALYVGFNGTDPVEVMYHNGPADGSTPDKGLTQVAYTAEIMGLQEAGDYENRLTYICTPTY